MESSNCLEAFLIGEVSALGARRMGHLGQVLACTMCVALCLDDP